MGGREIVDPIRRDDGWESHPAWTLIRAARVTGGAVLFDSDVRHQHYVVVMLARAERKRDLHRDHLFPRREIFEVAMSEAQWASFVSSMNSGSGVPATLTWDATCDDPAVPAVPFEPRLAESIAEVEGAAAAAVEEVRAAFAEYAAHKTVGNLRTLQARIDNLPANLRFAASSLSGHAEDVVQRAKADIEAFVVAKAQQLGLEPGDVGLPELTVGDAADQGRAGGRGSG